MPELPNLGALSVAIYIVAIVLELLIIRLRGESRYELRDTATSLAMAVGFFASGLLLGFLGVVTLSTIQKRWGLVDWGWSPAAFLLCALLFDLRMYWFHRCQHELRILWAAHVTHHSSQHYNFATAIRNAPTAKFVLPFIFTIPLALLGFPIEMLVFVAGISALIQFWQHTELVRRLPAPIEYIFVTPSHHRVHHASNPRYLDANYGAVLILWDRLFGTFIPEDDHEPVRYGLVRNLGTFNPVRVATHEWVAMLRDVFQPGIPWRARLGYLFGRPGYSHDGSRETTVMLRARHRRALTLGPRVHE